jgi:hypothetical protein
MEQEILINKVENALRTLLANDHYLLEIDVHERTITHRLAMYLQNEFLDWNVDCEYNRNWDEVKQIQTTKQLSTTFPQISSHNDSVTIFPDIIIHHRKSSDNLLVIEVKKTTSSLSNLKLRIQTF